MSAVLDYYQGLADDVQRKTFFGSFSIKKASNIYGLIFGSAHPLGIEKFLRVCWKIDPARGEANFDIDDDRIDEAQPSLFQELNIPKKLQLFEQQLGNRICSGELQTDGSIYIACLRAGFLPKHGRKVLQDIMKRKIIHCKAKPRISMAGYKEPRQLERTDG